MFCLPVWQFFGSGDVYHAGLGFLPGSATLSAAIAIRRGLKTFIMIDTGTDPNKKEPKNVLFLKVI
jgi:hypothetical protein